MLKMMLFTSHVLTAGINVVSTLLRYYCMFSPLLRGTEKLAIFTPKIREKLF